MVEGVNAITYGKVIPSGSHSAVIPNVCVGCHMQPVAITDPAFGQAGGHTYSMTYKVVTGGVTNTLDKVDVCVKCHGPITDFNFARKDYDGDGVIEGIQSEVQHLLDKLSRLLPNSTYRADGNYAADGLVKSPSVKTNWQTKFLNAAWNWQFVNVEGSKGVHNATPSVCSRPIADLTGMPTTLCPTPGRSNISAAPAPNAAERSPAGDGIPNWLKYALGSIPPSRVVVPDGVVWANSTPSVATNTLHIYTAAEISFDTGGKMTYQLQAVVSSLGGGCGRTSVRRSQDRPIHQLCGPTRSRRQFYRVAHTP
jgi:hypothetical protein